MAIAEPWQTAEVAGPKKALVISKPEVAAAMIKRAKHPIIVVGHKAAELQLEDKKLIDYLIELAKKGNIPVVATAHVVGEFLKRGYASAVWMPVVDIGNRLVDSEWCGFDGRGQYDLAIFVGLPYYMEWVILSGLKSFATKLTTMTLENVYHPNASWSFAKHSKKDWAQNLKVIIANVGGEQANVNV
jgi:acetyl-CoA decarbonylase/synthase complex subunit epsilon